MSKITRILGESDRGYTATADELLPLVAAVRLGHERPGHTVDATLLVLEVNGTSLIGRPIGV